MSKMKAAVLEKDEATRTTLPAKPASNPYLEAAKEGGNKIGKLLKFVKGEWEVGDDVIPDGTEFVAHIDQLVRGWVKFEDGKVVDDRNVGKIADGYKPPPRQELGDMDPTKWIEKDDKDGKPRDPWSEQWYLPMINVNSGELLTFVTGSKGGIGAVADLCRCYGHKYQDGLLPIVAIKTRSYKHKQFGRIETPEFAVVGWDGGPQTKTEAGVIPATHDDLYDEIPEF